MSGWESSGTRRLRGVELLRARFGERLRELLPGGELSVFQPIGGSGLTAAKGRSAGVFTWQQTDTAVQFEAWVDLDPSLTKVRALPSGNLTGGLLPVLLAPQLTMRCRLWLERSGWSYFTSSGETLLQHHDPLIAIRLGTAQPAAHDLRVLAAPDPAASRRVVPAVPSSGRNGQ